MWFERRFGWKIETRFAHSGKTEVASIGFHSKANISTLTLAHRSLLRLLYVPADSAAFAVVCSHSSTETSSASSPFLMWPKAVGSAPKRRPLLDIQAARALLSDPEGSPRQAGVGLCSGGWPPGLLRAGGLLLEHAGLRLHHLPRDARQMRSDEPLGLEQMRPAHMHMRTCTSSRRGLHMPRTCHAAHTTQGHLLAPTSPRLAVATPSRSSTAARFR